VFSIRLPSPSPERPTAMDIRHSTSAQKGVFSEGCIFRRMNFQKGIVSCIGGGGGEAGSRQQAAGSGHVT
jgi:hypothetical protein